MSDPAPSGRPSVAGRAASWAAAAAPRLSFRGAGSTGRILGLIAWAVDRRHRRVARSNVARCFPDAPDSWRRRVVRGAFAQAGRSALELLWSPALDRGDQEPKVGSFEGLDHLRQALDRGDGVIMASAHFGNWELMGQLLGRRGIRLHVIARRLDDPHLETAIRRLRTASGNRVIYKDRAVRGALGALREGDAVAVLNDQNTLRSDATFVPFFGRLAATSAIVAQLHLRTGAPLLPAFAVPAGDGYRFVIESPVAPPSRSREEAATELTAAVTARIEARVRRTPEAWLWMHDRWRTRPA